MNTQTLDSTTARGATLARKILLRVLPVVVLSLFLVGLSNHFVARAQISQYIDGEVRMLAEQVAASAESFLDQRDRDLETLVESPVLSDYYMNVEYGLHLEAGMYQNEIEQWFLQFAHRTDVYDLVAYYDDAGELVAGVFQGHVIDRAAMTPALPVTLPDMAQVNRYRSSILTQGERPQIVIAGAVRQSDQTFRGTLVLVCDLATLTATLRRTQIGTDGRAYLRDATGQALLGARPSDQAGLHHTVPLTGSPWSAVVEAHAEEFIGPLVYLRNLTLLLSFVVALLVSVPLIAGVRWAMRPLNEITEGTRRLALGELDHRLPMPELRDLKPLVLAFNDMAGKLKERNEQLQVRIRQLSALRLMENTATQGMNQETILRTCLRAVADGLSFDRVGLYWIKRDENAIVGRYIHINSPNAFNETSFRQRRVPLGEQDVLNRVITSREALLVQHPDAVTGVNPNYVRETGTKEFVMAPLCGKDEVFGVIVADNHATGAPLSENHRDGLLLFASAAGLALENATLIERITDSEARHRMVLDNSPVAILGIARDHRIRTWNRGAQAIFGYAPQQILGRPLRSLIAPHALPQFEALVEQLMQHGAVHEHQIEGRTCDGKELSLSVSWGGRDQNNVLANDDWTVVINDVTQSRKLQEQLIVSEKLSAVGQLIAGVAHELNNPLQAVVGYAELMLEDVPDARVLNGLQHVFNSATRCQKIIENLLLFVRHGDVVRGPVCVQDAVEASLKLLRHKLTRGPKIDVAAHMPEAPLHVMGNFQQIEQVLINLIGNACDALETVEGPRRIAIHVRPQGERVRLEIADTGPGVPEDVKDQLFEPFFTTKPEGRGTGLGLPLCRQIIEDHSGALEVVNGQEGGATFYFELPMMVQAAQTTAATETAEQDVAAQRLLLLEDESAVRALLRDVMTAEGHEVHAAENVQQARALAASQPFGLVITDIHLPDGTGLDFFQTWARHSTQPRPRFLLLTGDIVTEEMEQVCRQSGASILQKPINLREFRGALRSLLTSPQLSAS